MNTILHNKIKTAQKSYNCAASDWIINYGGLSDLMNDFKMPFSDRRKLVTMLQQKYRINIGDRYLEQVGIFDGDFACLKFRLDAVEICEKYNLYCE